MAEHKHDGMSIGFDYHNARKETRRINGVKVACIIAADLYEISYLYGQGLGAVHDAYATLKDADYTRTLQDECSGGNYQYEGAAINVIRALQKIINK